MEVCSLLVGRLAKNNPADRCARILAKKVSAFLPKLICSPLISNLELGTEVDSSCHINRVSDFTKFQMCLIVASLHSPSMLVDLFIVFRIYMDIVIGCIILNRLQCKLY